MRGFDPNYPRVVLGVLAVVTLLALAFAASTSTAAFGAYNPSWDGAADLRGVADGAGVESELVRNASRYASVSANDTLAVVLSPERGYGPAETDRVRRFVREGGTLLVAEDVDTSANDLLAGVGASARIDGRPLRDERYNYRSSAMPIARNVSAHPLTEGVGSLTLNHGTAVRAGPGGAMVRPSANDADRKGANATDGNVTVLASTSAFAYRDANRNAALDAAESLGRYPVATVESVGEGRVIAVGDPSLFINAMLDRPGNRAFVQRVFGAHGRVLLDYSHAGRLPPLALATLVVRERPLFQFLLGAAGVAAVGLWARRPGLPARVREMVPSIGTGKRDVRSGPEELAAFVRARHPDWDDERIERVIGGIMHRRGEDPDDE